jgi:DNA-binding MarR family transcriptional regulator
MTATDTDRAKEAITLDLVFRLLGTAHAVTELLDGALRELGLSAATLRLLTELVNAPQPLQPSELDRAAIGGGGGGADVGRLVDGLERDGLVRRTPQSGSGRSVRIVITARGRARQQAAAAHVDAVASQLATTLGGADATALERALSALR